MCLFVPLFVHRNSIVSHLRCSSCVDMFRAHGDISYITQIHKFGDHVVVKIVRIT